MTPRWTVVIEIDSGVTGAARTTVIGSIVQLAQGAGVDIRESSRSAFVAFTADQDTADRVAAGARGIDAVTAAYVKPPDTMP